MNELILMTKTSKRGEDLNSFFVTTQQLYKTLTTYLSIRFVIIFGCPSTGSVQAPKILPKLLSYFFFNPELKYGAKDFQPLTPAEY